MIMIRSHGIISRFSRDGMGNRSFHSGNKQGSYNTSGEEREFMNCQMAGGGFIGSRLCGELSVCCTPDRHVCALANVLDFTRIEQYLKQLPEIDLMAGMCRVPSYTGTSAG